MWLQSFLFKAVIHNAVGSGIPPRYAWSVGRGHGCGLGILTAVAAAAWLGYSSYYHGEEEVGFL